jgi:hypothetical protein
MSKVAWLKKETAIPEWNLECDVLHIHIIGLSYRRLKATWYVWIGEDNTAALMGNAETMEQAQKDAMAATRELMEKVKVALDAPLVRPAPKP